ncbi:hypothetical protein B0H17DRAFT_1127182 [Mycena rosella]|uniref:Uncharacterized protein n=1 Tax=Mycena rosella TaxID=1033263 RepID=A0AAD7E165_MYCRO|nr:hypothetical protein B0H17DRAFT_1127182 [Mycena rosella]
MRCVQFVAKINPKRVPIYTEVLLQVYFSMIANLVQDARFDNNLTNRHRNDSAPGALRIRSSQRSRGGFRSRNPILILTPNNVQVLVLAADRTPAPSPRTRRQGYRKEFDALRSKRASESHRTDFRAAFAGLVLGLTGSAYASTRWTRWIFGGEMRVDLRWGDGRRETLLTGLNTGNSRSFEVALLSPPTAPQGLASPISCNFDPDSRRLLTIQPVISARTLPSLASFPLEIILPKISGAPPPILSHLLTILHEQLSAPLKMEHTQVYNGEPSSNRFELANQKLGYLAVAGHARLRQWVLAEKRLPDGSPMKWT